MTRSLSFPADTCITGTLVDEGGNPLDTQPVNSSIGEHIWTDNMGRFTFAVGVGQPITVFALGTDSFHSDDPQGAWVPGDPCPYDIGVLQRLPTTCSRGLLEDEVGAPVPNMELVYEMRSKYDPTGAVLDVVTKHTEADGSFCLPSNPDTVYHLRPTHYDAGPGLHYAEDFEPSTTVPATCGGGGCFTIPTIVCRPHAMGSKHTL